MRMIGKCSPFLRPAIKGNISTGTIWGRSIRASYSTPPPVARAGGTGTVVSR